MRHQQIRLTDLETVEEHMDAIESIENDRHNSDGDWFSGRETTLKPGAVTKIKAIWTRFDRLFPDTEC